MSFIQRLKNSFNRQKADYQFGVNLDFTQSSEVKLSLLPSESERIFLSTEGYLVTANLRIPAPIMGGFPMVLVDFEIVLERAPQPVQVRIGMGWLTDDVKLSLVAGSKNRYYGTIPVRVKGNPRRNLHCEVKINHLE